MLGDIMMGHSLRVSDKEEAMGLFDDLYTNQEVIPIRDIKMLIAFQTHDSRFNFEKMNGVSTLKIIKKGKKVDEKIFKNEDDFYACITAKCGISF